MYLGLNMRNSDTCQQGRSMVEILGVLAIIGVLSIGGIAGYSKAMEKINIDKLIEDVSMTSRKIKNLYADQKSYADLDKNAFELNLVANIRKSEGADKKMIHIMNGEVIIKPIARNKGFVMIYNGLTEKACSQLASTDWGGEANGLRYLVVSPTGVIAPRGFPSNLDSGEYSAKDLPLSPSEAAIHCNCNKLFKCGIAWFYD